MLNKIEKLKKQASWRAGASLLEVVIALALLGVIITVFGTVLFALRLAYEAHYRNRASAIAEAGLDALRSANPAIISDQTNSPFLGTIINHGSWSVFATSTAPSGTKAIREAASSPASAPSARGACA